MNQIQVRNKRLASEFAHNKPWAVISISNPDCEYAVFQHMENLKAILPLKFYDIDEKEKSSLVGFSEANAELILDFMEVWGDQIDLLLVHCEAGMSRSPGVAAALSNIFFGEDDSWFKNYFPNSLVYKTILNVNEQRATDDEYL